MAASSASMAAAPGVSSSMKPGCSTCKSAGQVAAAEPGIARGPGEASLSVAMDGTAPTGGPRQRVATRKVRQVDRFGHAGRKFFFISFMQLVPSCELFWVFRRNPLPGILNEPTLAMEALWPRDGRALRS